MTRAWIGPAMFQVNDVENWISAGARLVGGCCRVGPAEIRGIRDLVSTKAALSSHSTVRAWTS